MRKYFILLFCTALLASCTGNHKKSNLPTLTVTIEPLRYFAETIVGDKYQVVSMVPDGTSPETYDPNPQQLVALSKSKAYFQIGHIGFERTWIHKLQDNCPNIPFFDLSKGVNLIREQDCHNHDSHEHAHSHDGVEPHIWNSTQNAHIIAENIYQAVAELDQPNASYYKHRLDSLNKIIRTTDETVRKLLNDADKTFLIYHPALTYFARDYGLTQVSIEEAGKEPSPSQLQQLIKTCKNSQTRIIFVQKEFDIHNAQMIANEIGVKVIPINPLNYHWQEEMLQIARALNHSETTNTAKSPSL